MFRAHTPLVLVAAAVVIAPAQQAAAGSQKSGSQPASRHTSPLSHLLLRRLHADSAASCHALRHKASSPARTVPSLPSFRAEALALIHGTNILVTSSQRT